nr:TVP38/TMEM64 family protein [Desulfobulbaceae bacterium]
MPDVNTKKNYWPIYVVLTLIIGGIILCTSLIDICPLLEVVLPSLKINKSTIVTFIRSLGGWGPVGSIGLMIMHSFVPFPSELLTIANGMIFGPLWGVIITWIGSMLAAYASFGLTRLYGRPFVAKRIKPSQLEKLDTLVSNQGAVSLLIGRLIPLISFNLINYGAGLTKISWWTFTWTTGIGILPMTIVMVTMGNNFSALPWWIWLVVLLTFLALSYAIKYVHKRYAGRP